MAQQARVGQDDAMSEPSSAPGVKAAERYVEVATGGGKGMLADLFAEDAEFHHPHGGSIYGREAIRAFYDRFLANVTPSFHVVRVAAAGNECWIELADGPASSDLVATDHFTVDADGLITRLAVFLYSRPAR